MKLINILLLLSVSIICCGGSKSTITHKFKNKIKGADKIVVWDNMSVYNDEGKRKEYFTVTNPKEIKELYSNIIFLYREPSACDCDCVGYPGIEWYKKGKCIFSANSKHGKGLWIGSNNWILAKKSRLWLAKWLLKHKFPDRRKETKKIIEKSKKAKGGNDEEKK